MKYTIDFTKSNGLVPIIIQDYKTLAVLMLGYMNQTAWQKTIETGRIYFWSRSRQKLWMKGEKSGNTLQLKAIYIDCDTDAILIKAKLIGKRVCHTDNRSCFYTKIGEKI